MYFSYCHINLNKNVFALFYFIVKKLFSNILSILHSKFSETILLDKIDLSLSKDVIHYYFNENHIYAKEGKDQKHLECK